jgi:HSP20 family molecular chaperone IbpA
MSVSDFPPSLASPPSIIREFPSINRYFSSSLFDDDIFSDILSDIEKLPFERSLLNRKFLPLEVKESSKAYVVNVDLPGYGRENIKVDIKDRVLTITGERKRNKEEKDGRYSQQERFSGEIKRSFHLPDDVDENKIEAKYENGVLSINMNKKPDFVNKSKSKSITIK